LKKPNLVRAKSFLDNLNTWLQYFIGETFTIELECECPKQQNGYDCGVFVCMNILRIFSNQKPQDPQAKAAKFRIQMYRTLTNAFMTPIEIPDSDSN
jgi:Ulp1 family protease